MPTKLIPYTDAAGRRHWIEVEAETAAALHSFDEVMRRREKQYRQHIRTETDVKARRDRRPRKERSARLVGYLNVEHETAYRIANRVDPGNPWEGPRYTFTHLLGESPTWPGQGVTIHDQRLWRERRGAWVCAFCEGKKLEPHQACLGCGSAGR